MKKTAVLILVVIVHSLVLIACSGSGTPSKSVKVTMTDFSFSPNTFTVPAGQPISIEVTNNGAVQHSFLIMKQGHQIQAHFTEADKTNVYWEVASVPAGESVRDTFTAPADPGEYQIVCGIAGHFEAGMVAKLKVVQQP
jgi:uncharacterized cupredoxin-like copper-binding protein